ncbi:MAG: hypothetical protein WCK60_00685 [Candidatus Nomurabacteria bacterium]
MATESKRPTRTHVSGFVKGFHENRGHGVITFRVIEQKFVLPRTSTFASEITKAKKNDWNVIVLFSEDGTVHPKITGVITKPKWRQHNAAAAGEDYETVKALK